jgi:hypothetical protein
LNTTLNLVMFIDLGKWEVMGYYFQFQCSFLLHRVPTLATTDVIIVFKSSIFIKEQVFFVFFLLSYVHGSYRFLESYFSKSNTNNLTNSHMRQALSRMSSLSGRMNIARVNIEILLDTRKSNSDVFPSF